MSIDRFEEAWPDTPSHRPARDNGKKLTDFIAGPISGQWLRRTHSISMAAVKVGVSLWEEAGLNADPFFKQGMRQSQPIRVHQRLRKRNQLSRYTVSRGLKALAEAGLIVFEDDSDGRYPTVTIQNISVILKEDSSVPF
jgi:hypothetical protein